MKNGLVVLLIICLYGVVGFAQIPTVFNVDFNDCTEMDSDANRIGVFGGDPQCVCGVDGMAFRFDGFNDSIGYQNGIERILNQDFALSFYYFIENPATATGSIDLISFGDEGCQRDSSLTVRYIPQSNSIRAEISINNSIFFPLFGEVPAGPCWNYVVVNKDDDGIELYINNVLADENDQFDRDFRFKPDGILSVAASPCISNFASRFQGLIDEIRLYDRVLDEDEIISLNINPDQIITPSQTIFLGESIQIETGASCSNTFAWDPGTTLDDPLSMTPVASPVETTTYQYTVDFGICSSVDSVRISVVDPSVSRCDELLLPNAFTPNDDRRNDEFGISNDFIIDDLISFQVFSKWGEKMFETNSVEEQWDGTYQGEALNPGTFLYRVVYTCSGEQFSSSGSFVLIN